MESARSIRQKLTTSAYPPNRGVKKGEAPTRTESPSKPAAEPTESFSLSGTWTQAGEPSGVTSASANPVTVSLSEPALTHTTSPPPAVLEHLSPDGTRLEMSDRGTLIMFDESANSYTTQNMSFSPQKVQYVESAAKESSHAALLAVDTGSSAKLAATGATGAWMTAAASVGGGLLFVYGLTKAITGENARARMAGVAEAGWGGQSFIATNGIGAGAGAIAQGLGILGGAIQTGLGAKKAAEGLGLVKNEDGEKVKSMEKAGVGAAETLAGVSWILASAGVASGVTLPAFVAITLGAKAYEHRDKLAGVAKAGMGKLKSAAQVGTEKLRAAGQKIDSSLLSRLKPGGRAQSAPG